MIDSNKKMNNSYIKIDDTNLDDEMIQDILSAVRDTFKENIKDLIVGFDYVEHELVIKTKEAMQFGPHARAGTLITIDDIKCHLGNVSMQWGRYDNYGKKLNGPDYIEVTPEA